MGSSTDRSSQGSMFDLTTQDGVLRALYAVRTSELTTADRNNLRDQLFLLSRSEDPRLREQLEAQLSQLELSDTFLATAASQEERAAATAQTGFATGRRVPKFSIQKRPQPTRSAGEQAEATNATDTVAVSKEQVASNEAEAVPETPQPSTVNQTAPIEHTAVEEPQPESHPEPTVEPVAQQTNQADTKTDESQAHPATATTQANELTLERIREIKRYVNERIGNPVNLVDLDNGVGRSYMSALLAAMQSVNNETGRAGTEEMHQLEQVFSQVEALLLQDQQTEHQEPTPEAAATKPTPDHSAVEQKTTADATAPVTAEPTQSAPAPEEVEPPTPEPSAEPATPAPAVSDPVPEPVQESPMSAPEPSGAQEGESSAPAEPQPDPVPAVPDTVEPHEASQEATVNFVPGHVTELRSQADAHTDQTTSSKPVQQQTNQPQTEPHGQISHRPLPKPAVASVAPVGAPPQDTPENTEAKPISPASTNVVPEQSVVADPASPMEPQPATSHDDSGHHDMNAQQATVAQDTKNSIDNQMTRLDEAAAARNAFDGDPLYAPDVDAGLQQLLLEWSLFKSSGLFGTGPNGREHPLFKKLAPLMVNDILLGKFDGSRPEIVQSVTDYMNGWRYEQGIVYQPGETFEVYLRRVIRFILDNKRKS